MVKKKLLKVTEELGYYIVNSTSLDFKLRQKDVIIWEIGLGWLKTVQNAVKVSSRPKVNA